MIPLARRTCTRRAPASVAYSRQALPRPARYTTPSHPSHAQALAPKPANHEYYLAEMQSFLRRPPGYTLLPTPLPSDASSPENTFYFLDSRTQDQIAMIDALLHNLHDVPRAKDVFDSLRKERGGQGVVEARVYDAMIGAYVEMAWRREPWRRTRWIEEAVGLWEVMEDGMEGVEPTLHTYASMLLVWIRFNPESETSVPRTVDIPDPETLLKKMDRRGIPVSLVVANRMFTDDAEAQQAIKLLSKAAVVLKLPDVIKELGAAEVLGSQLPDPLGNVPEANPVLKAKKPTLKATHAPDGTVISMDVDSPEKVEYEVPFNLSNLRKHLAQVTLAKRILPEDVSARQKLLEQSVYDIAKERFEYQAEKLDELGLGNKGLENADLRAWMWDWHTKLTQRLKTSIPSLLQSEASGVSAHGSRLSPISSPMSSRPSQTRLGPFLSLLKPEKLSLITILELMHLQGSGGVAEGMKTARALLAVGKAVEMEWKAEVVKRGGGVIPDASVRPSSSSSESVGERQEEGHHPFFSPTGYRALQARRVAARKYVEDSEEWTSDWTQLIRVRVGSFLVDCLMDVASVVRVGEVAGEKVTETQPAFYHSYEYLRGHKLGIIKLNPAVSERIAQDRLRETLHPRHLPMLVKPKSWLSPDEGGYLYSRSTVMRFKDSQEQLTYLRHASALGNLELVYAGLDVLGSTPWKINRGVFDVVLKVWNLGERLGKLPPAVFDQPEPEKPANYETDPKARSVYLQKLKAWSTEKANHHSDRCSVNYKLEIARTFLGDTLYLPHNLDFRGRAYPIPPHLNHIGDDLSRGLMMFGEGRKVGERGLRWLKIHLANLAGVDKGTFDERVEFVDRMVREGEVRDSAENPLEGRRWWTKADDPWQCLATCIELNNALKLEDPTEYVCALPVHQDGTCNGLQHYAALGGDATGAAQVNLAVSEKPSDVYTYVAEMVEDEIAKDVEKGDRYAMMLQGKVARKVVKQTVMTTVYGVTFVGARDQIERQLRDRGDVDVEECWMAASYLAKKTLACIGDLFSGAKAIQTWLNLAARLISKSIPPERAPEASSSSTKAEDLDKDGEGQKKRKKPLSNIRKEQMTSVIWTTPLGLPIVQPYRQTKKKQITTSLQTVYISDPNMPAVVNGQKQASAFPPNFIHSLDATHMMLTALECRERNIAFASVHDSYWTHPCSVDEMSRIIRDTFIALHSSDVLGKLNEEFRERYKGYKIPISSLGAGGLLEKLGYARKNGVGDGVLKKGEGEVVLDESLAESAEEGVVDVTEVSEDGEGEIEAEAEVEVEEKKPRKRGRPPKVHATLMKNKTVVESKEGEEGGEEEDTRFINLVDVLPPVPQKGGFDVNTIRKSLYFFS